MSFARGQDSFMSGGPYLALSGGTVTGAVTFSGAVTITGQLAITGDPTITGTLAITKDAVGTAQTAGDSLINSTAAAAGAQQYSPMFRLEGQGWKTNATAASQKVEWALQNRPVEGAANPTARLDFLSQINSGGWTTSATLSTVGPTFSVGYVSATDVADYALSALNGGCRVKGSIGFDAYDAAVLIVGRNTATGVRVGKAGGTLGFYGTTPIAIGASVADATGGATVDAEARTAINALISRIEALGLITTV